MVALRPTKIPSPNFDSSHLPLSHARDRRFPGDRGTSTRCRRLWRNQEVGVKAPPAIRPESCGLDRFHEFRRQLPRLPSSREELRGNPSGERPIFFDKI